ncbi:MAG: hypothetical protein WAW11_00700 [Patescibacteria group bacterium]
MNIIGKIELPPREVRINPERYHDFLLSKMTEIQQEVNGSYGKILNGEAIIKMEGTSDAATDKELVEQQEEAWANEQYKDLETWRADRSKNASNIAEMAVTLVLHKFLKDNFIVARASKYDDYNHGVDNVIIDKKTGSVICGFDEVIGLDESRDGSEKKMKKVKNSLERGGTAIKYGATVIDDKIVRQSFKNIPTFYLSLSKQELGQLLVDLQKNEDHSEVTTRIFSQLTNSLEEQYLVFKELNISNNVRENLEKFAESLSAIKQLI